MDLEKNERKGLSTKFSTALFFLLTLLPFGLHVAMQSGNGWAQAGLAGAIVVCMGLLVWLG